MKLKEQARRVWGEGSRRRVIVTNDGKQVAQAPLNFVALGSLIAPMMAVLAGIAIFATGGAVKIEETRPAEAPADPSIDSGVVSA